ncbi:MAG: branched-chain amino acid aminotransferase [Planctomycetota bacterium]|jgi:branched-chain amino acid aminotransferase
MKVTPSERIWFNGKLVPWDQAQTHVLSHVIHYGSGAFEGMRAYAHPKGPALVGLDEHIQRLFRSCHIISLPLPFEPQEIRQGVIDVVRDTGYESCYIRPFAFRGYGELGVDPTNAPVEVAIAAFPWGALMGAEALAEGVDVGVSSWRRMAPDTHPAMAKAAGNYLNSQMVLLEAKRHGYAEAVVLDVDGYVCEGSGENIFLVRDGKLLTPPPGSSILEGVTRSYVIQLAKELGMEVIEARIAREMLYTSEEVFFTGTAAEVTPIRSVDGKQVGDGALGPVTKKLQGAYFDVIEGRTNDRHNWLTHVTKE